LIGIPSYKIYTESNIVKGKELVGFGSVLVVHTMQGEYKAFDLACPKEANSAIRVYIDDDYNAVCPECGSKFEVILNSSSGMCIEGSAKYPLRYYLVIGSGSNKLIVRN
jgi:nitrite reductase/ring-hydroxylating ferredoxin subunit